MYRDGLPSISADLLPIRLLTGLGPFNQWLLTYTCSARPQTCFLNIMQQQDPNNTLLDPKLMYCKHQRCECIQKRQMHRQLRAFLPAFLTDPSSRAKTSIYLWFLVSLCYSLKLCFLIQITIAWLATGATEKVCNESNLLPNQPIYSSIYTTSVIVQHNLPSSFSTTCSL
jgi:hypothetical protein